MDKRIGEVGPSSANDATLKTYQRRPKRKRENDTNEGKDKEALGEKKRSSPDFAAGKPLKGILKRKPEGDATEGKESNKPEIPGERAEPRRSERLKRKTAASDHAASKAEQEVLKKRVTFDPSLGEPVEKPKKKLTFKDIIKKVTAIMQKYLETAKLYNRIDNNIKTYMYDTNLIPKDFTLIMYKMHKSHLAFADHVKNQNYESAIENSKDLRKQLHQIIKVLHAMKLLKSQIEEELDNRKNSSPSDHTTPPQS